MMKWLVVNCCAALAVGQSFDVASIRLHGLTGQSGPQRVGILIAGTRVTASAMSVSNLIEYAYDLKLYQVSGGPNWTKSDRWDIAATAEGDGVLPKDRVRKMFQNLLADRFQVQLRREVREMPVYTLVVGKGGPKMKESAPEARSLLRMSGNRTIQITTTRGSIEQLVNQLSGNLDRPVLDKTSLTGNYDYQLEWAPENSPAATDLGAPSIFTAIQEQLGLKLESTKGPIETFVIDRVEKPSEN